MTKIAFKPTTLSVASTDTFSWTGAYGGFWGIPSYWEDATAGAAAINPPGASSIVAITGGVGDAFTNINGVGAAGQLSIAQDVLFWGSVTVGGTLALLAAPYASTELDLDGGASLTAGSLTLATGTTLEVAGGSTLQATGGATLTDGFLLAASHGSVQLGALVANGFAGSHGLTYGTIAVDDTGAVEVGTVGGAAPGAITIDPGQSAAVSGTMDGTVVLNGTLAVQAGGVLVIDANDPFGAPQGISGSGTLFISENSQVTLGVADSAAIQFSGPAGTLILDVLPSGIISGFSASDIIELPGGLASGVSYTQTSAGTATLTLTKGARVVGTLTLAGNYAGSQFHLRLDAAGDAFISLQTVGSAPAQPTTIIGTPGSDTLVATASNQTLTGYGGNDVLSGGGFTGVDFEDTSADLSGSTIQSFIASDTIDLTDMRPGSVSVLYTPAVYSTTASPVPGTLVVTDGTHTATLALSPTMALPAGSWSTGSDGAGGTDLEYTTLNIDAYAFAPLLGGPYSVASNWQDTTTAATATQGPGIGNGVTVTGGATFLDLTGSGVAASLTTSGDVLLFGSLNVGSVTPGISGALIQTGTLALDGGASLVLAGSAAVGGLIEVGGGGRLTDAGSVTFTSNSASLEAVDGGVLQFGGVIASGNTSYPPSLIMVDANSSIEFGSAGGAKAGALTIDNGVTASLGGTIEGNVVVNGTLATSDRSLAIDPFGLASPLVSGTGTLEIDSGGVLTLAGSDTAAIQFSASSTGTLALGSILPTGTMSLFAKGDAITLTRPVTTLRYSQTGNAGTLTLFDGSATVGTLLLAGSYSVQQFQVQVSAGGASSTITYAAIPNAATGTQISSSSDAYGWSNTTGGAWSNAGNWTDATTGNAATTAPGIHDAIVIQDNPGGATSQIISGSGSAASLAIYTPAGTDFTGSISVAGAFWVANDAASGVVFATGASLSVGDLDDYGSLQIEGATATVTGLLDSTEVVGTLNVVDGGIVTSNGSPDIDGGTIGVDATSRIEFGTAGGAATGAMTIDAGQTASDEQNGTIAAALVVNGTLIEDNGTIEGFGGSTGSIGGTGTIQIGAAVSSGKLTLRASDSAALLFYHGGNSGSDNLEVHGPIPTGAISGFSAGDTIQLDQTVTGVSFSQSNNAQGTLYLLNGATLVGTLIFLGNYAADRFQVDVAAATGFATISLLPATSSGGSSPSNTSYDAYSWTGPSGGSWSSASNWQDTTTGTAPGTVPGTNSNPATIAMNATIGGNGTTGNLTVTASVVLTGQITASWTTAIASGPGQPASIAVTGGGRLITANATIAGSWEVEGGSVGVVYYFATLAGGAMLCLGGSTIQVGALVTTGSGDVVGIDSDSIIKVGGPVPAALGSLTLGPNTYTALAGSIYGNVVAAGTLQTIGGGTLFIDMTGAAESDPYSSAPTISGSGGLWLTEGSTMGLGAADSAAIQFGGPNATLVLATLPTGTISGFAAGDAIQVDQTVTGLNYQQGTGTLTLTNGAATVGALKLAGSYGGDAFHLDTAANGASATITLQTLGIAATQPTLIQGSAGSDVLTATANGQTLTGNGGNDTMSAGGFSAIDFKDLTSLMNYYTVTGFTTSDWLDFTDLNPNTAWVSYAGGVVTVFDGAHAANMHLTFATTPASGSFSITSDGAGGSKVAWS